MASSNTVKNYGTIVEWHLSDATGTNATTSTIAWYSTATPPTAKDPSDYGTPSTDTYWMVKTITYIPSTAETSGTYMRLMEKDSSGPVLFQANLMTGEDVVSQTYDPPLRCRPIWWSTLGTDYATGGKWVFQLA